MAETHYTRNLREPLEPKFQFCDKLIYTHPDGTQEPCIYRGAVSAVAGHVVVRFPGAATQSVPADRLARNYLARVQGRR